MDWTPAEPLVRLVQTLGDSARKEHEGSSHGTICPGPGSPAPDMVQMRLLGVVVHCFMRDNNNASLLRHKRIISRGFLSNGHRGTLRVHLTASPVPPVSLATW